MKVNRGIFQGDSFSPLLFVLCMIPISLVLRKEKAGYKWGKKAFSLNHLLSMDDLKLYRKNEKQIDSLVRTVVQHEKAATFLDILKNLFRPTLVRV